MIYLLCLLSPVAFLLGYIVGSPKQVAVPDWRYERMQSERMQSVRLPVVAVGEEGAVPMVDKRLRLEPNSVYAAR
ncbi:MAG: hypothetical protein NW208_18690 [Bryobacter sp.]|nr:hypothetical protein [Bryobacter sp.]